jgi:hypothetical protein
MSKNTKFARVKVLDSKKIIKSTISCYKKSNTVHVPKASDVKASM